MRRCAMLGRVSGWTAAAVGVITTALAAAPGETAQLKPVVGIYGSTVCAVTACVAAARMNASCAMVEPSNHLFGMSSGGLSSVDLRMPLGGMSTPPTIMADRCVSDDRLTVFGGSTAPNPSTRRYSRRNFRGEPIPAPRAARAKPNPERLVGHCWAWQDSGCKRCRRNNQGHSGWTGHHRGLVQRRYCAQGASPCTTSHAPRSRRYLLSSIVANDTFIRPSF